MKHRHIALVAATLTACALPWTAAAQGSSTVEIYGQIGVGLNTRNHQGAGNGRITDMSTNAMNASFFGFRGSEDMGGGLRAVFRLESRLLPDSGGIGAPAGPVGFFDRQSFVGLTSTSWGALTLGRQFHASVDRGLRSLDVFQLAGANAHVVPVVLYGVNRNVGNDTRVNNSIKYRLDQPSGLQLGVSYGLGEADNSSALGSSLAVDFGYGNDNYNVGAMHITYKSPTTNTATRGIPKNRMWAVGGSMRFGNLRPYLTYYRSTIDAQAGTTPAQENRITALGLAWQASPAVSVKAGYYIDKGKTLNNVVGRNGDKKTLVLGAEYALSRRTSLYAALANNSLDGGFLQETLYAAALGRTPSASSVRFYSVGVNHRF